MRLSPSVPERITLWLCLLTYLLATGLARPSSAATPPSDPLRAWSPSETYLPDGTESSKILEVRRDPEGRIDVRIDPGHVWQYVSYDAPVQGHPELVLETRLWEVKLGMRPQDAARTPGWREWAPPQMEILPAFDAVERTEGAPALLVITTDGSGSYMVRIFTLRRLAQGSSEEFQRMRGALGKPRPGGLPDPTKSAESRQNR